jgi:hypothetical protein
MRRAVAVLLGTIAAGVVGLLIVTLVDRTPLAFTLGVTRGLVAAEVPPGEVACQGTIVVPQDGEFDRVRFSLGTYFKPGPPVEVQVLDAASGRVLARGALRGGYPDIGQAPTHAVGVGEVGARRRLRVCIANRGRAKVAIFGQLAVASASTSARLGDERLPNDLSLAFEREPRSLASLAPAILDRAALFRADWVGVWTYLLLAAAVLLAVPWLLIRALRSSGSPAR